MKKILLIFLFSLYHCLSGQVLSTPYLENYLSDYEIIDFKENSNLLFNNTFFSTDSNGVDSIRLKGFRIWNLSLEKLKFQNSSSNLPNSVISLKKNIGNNLKVIYTDNNFFLVSQTLDSNLAITSTKIIDSSNSIILSYSELMNDSSIIWTFNFDINKYQFIFFDDSLNFLKKETFQDSLQFTPRISLHFDRKLNLLLFNYQEDIYIKKVKENSFKNIGNIRSNQSANYRPYVYSEDSIINFLEYKDSLTFSGEFYSFLINTKYSLKTNLWSKSRLTEKGRVLNFDFKFGVLKKENYLSIIYTQQSQYNTSNIDTTYEFILGTIFNSKIIKETKFYEDHGILDAPSVFKYKDGFIMIYKKRIIDTPEGQKEKFVLVLLNNLFEVLSTDELEPFAEKNLLFYPNPTTYNLNLKEPLNQLIIKDLQGKTLLTENVFTKSINVSSLKPGIYLIVGFTKNGRLIKQKFVKE